jgi:hypothetical protein
MLTLLSGCANHNLYHWGEYQPQLYEMYVYPDKGSPQEQLLTLQADAEKARAKDKPLPPGYHAHLGYLYFQTGNKGEAIAAFEQEKALYPESQKFMDRLIAQVKK